jgi:hypothetical protein
MTNILMAHSENKKIIYLFSVATCTFNEAKTKVEK